MFALIVDLRPIKPEDERGLREDGLCWRPRSQCEHSVQGFWDLHEGTTAPHARSGLRGGAERALRSSMSGLQTGLTFLDRGADRALDGLEAII